MSDENSKDADSDLEFSVGTQNASNSVDGSQTQETQEDVTLDFYESSTVIAPTGAATNGTFSREEELPGPLVAVMQKELRDVDEWVGQKVGHFRLQRELGRGGMGVVYKAFDEKLRRDVAIKMILGGSGSHRDAKTRFETEAQAVAAMQHPGVVQLFDFGEWRGNPYFTLEYIDGGTLTESLSANPLSPKHAAKLVESLARTMQKVHDKCILHRDLKPSNILITSEGMPKISDFGLAKLLADSDQDTRTGTVMGTPSYMSPEQARGDTNNLTASTDQYSLGAILYACLSGRPPFMSSSTIDTITQVVNKEPIPLRQLAGSIPVDLETICLKTLQKDPAKRYSDCAELAEDLDRFLKGEPIQARPVGRVEKSMRWCKRNPYIAIPSALALTLLIAVAAISTWAWSTTAAQAVALAQETETANAERIKAIQQKVRAEEQERIATDQALRSLQNIQTVIETIDPKLSGRPGMNEIRIEIMRLLVDQLDEIDWERAGGIEGELTPTQLAARTKIATILAELGNRAAAVEEFSKLVAEGRDRILVNGRSLATVSNLAKLLLGYAGNTQHSYGNTQDTIGAFQEGVELAREAVDKHLSEAGIRERIETYALLGSGTQNFGVQQLRLGRVARAQELFEEALAANEQVLELLKSPEAAAAMSESNRVKAVGGYESQIMRGRDSLAYVMLRAGNSDEAIAIFEQSVETRRQSAEKTDAKATDQYDYAGLLKIYGKSLLWIRKLDEAETKLTVALKVLQELHATDPSVANYKSNLAEANYLMGTLRDLQNRPDESLSLFERSRLLREESYAADKSQKNAIDLMLSEARVGNRESAMKLIDLLAESEEDDGELHLERARALAQLSRAAETAEEKTEMIEAAIAAVKRSTAEGFVEAFRFRAEPDLAPIQEVQQFRDHIATLD
ncbi:MAG: serine/threonine-protein kinase [Pirellulaceae bacterium]